MVIRAELGWHDGFVGSKINIYYSRTLRENLDSKTQPVMDLGYFLNESGPSFDLEITLLRTSR